jgi:hypothetical protein
MIQQLGLRPLLPRTCGLDIVSLEKLSTQLDLPGEGSGGGLYCG